VFQEPQLTARADHAKQLAQRLTLVVEGAQHERDHTDVDAAAIQRYRSCPTSQYRHRHVRAGGRLLCQRSEVGLGFNGDHARRRGGVVGEVHAVARAHLDHVAGNAGQQLVTQRAHSFGLHTRH
jgi:hypothetical protein